MNPDIRCKYREFPWVIAPILREQRAEREEDVRRFKSCAEALAGIDKSREMVVAIHPRSKIVFVTELHQIN
jgi:hypothetical protein